MEFPFVKNIQTLFPCEDQGFLKEETKICCSLMHPDDLGRQPRLFQDAFRIYFSLPANERMSYIYCNEFRCNGIDGKYRWFLQKITFLKANGNGNPLLSYSTYADITPLKTDDTLNLYEDGINYKVKITKKYPLFRDKLKLSRKEIEILKMISDGYVSKQIADKLSISFHTVNTHRRNMLKKTHSVTSSELVSYARDFGII